MFVTIFSIDTQNSRLILLESDIHYDLIKAEKLCRRNVLHTHIIDAFILMEVTICGGYTRILQMLSALLQTNPWALDLCNLSTKLSAKCEFLALQRCHFRFYHNYSLTNVAQTLMAYYVKCGLWVRMVIQMEMKSIDIILIDNRVFSLM